MKEFTRTYSVIHLDSIYKNIEEAKKRVGSDTKIMAIVKANAYGHGAVEVAGAIKDKVYGFAVATVREALTLRESGVDNPILVLGYVCKAEYESVIRNYIIFAMLTKDMAKDISECAVRIGITAKCHIKINTGMNRIGFPVNEETIDDIAELTGYEGLDCEGIFMHFATADSADKSYAKHQFELFTSVIDEVEKKLGKKFKIRHCANTGAVARYPETWLDMVRPGLLLYGYGDFAQELGLKPVMSLKTTVSTIKTYPAGTAISYGGIYKTDRKTRMGVVPYGYADGYFRCLSNRYELMTEEGPAPQRGKICMDMCMIDLTDKMNVDVGSEVEIFGKANPIENMAQLAGTIPYELTCAVSKRVPRMYIKDGKVYEKELLLRG